MNMGIDPETIVKVIWAVAGTIGTATVGILFVNLQKHLDLLNKNTIAIAILTVEMRNMKKQFERFNED